MCVIRGIYKIINTVNNKIYIGQTNDISARWYNHIYELNGNKHPNAHLQNAWNRYGEDKFVFEIMYECDDNDDLNKIEKESILQYNSNNDLYGYNLTSGGEGYRLKQETKDKLSISKRGQKASLSAEDVHKIKMAMYCFMDRNEIANIFNANKKVLTSIAMGKTYNYILPELNDEIHNLKQKMIDVRNDYILKLYDNGHSIKNIVDLTGYTASVVEKCIYKNRKVNKNYNIRKLSREQEQEVVERYLNNNENSYELAKLFNVSPTTIMSIIHSHNLDCAS